MGKDKAVKTPTNNREFSKDFLLLCRLAEMGACRNTIKISTTALAKETGLSQQSTSRRLISLERKGLIQRAVTKEGSLIRISRDGEEYLRRIYLCLRSIFEEKPFSIKVEGKVFSGLGEGAYYVSKEPYRKQFIEKLGFDPYPGTLNLKITDDRESIKLRTELDAYPGIKIEGFKNKDRTYGPVKCFHAILDGRERGAVVFAFRSHYGRDVLEIISPICLRERLKLKDGDKVSVEIFLY
ncbi:MAG: DUF120 domain-containing protein [Candidatus Bathyarchaeota archaeon]|nr:DUF120 domain-containing protein [Candidatus Bathyarchaeota archaeon]